jgi:hypothetical protein
MPVSRRRKSTRFPHIRTADRIQPYGRLVQDQEAGAVDQSLSEFQAADHPARVGPDHALGGIGETHRLEGLVDDGLPVAAGHVEEPGVQHQVLSPGEGGVGGKLLGHVAEQPAHGHGLGADVEAEHLGGALAQREQGGQDADGGGLAGAVGPEKTEHPACRYGQIDVVDRHVVGEAVR